MYLYLSNSNLILVERYLQNLTTAIEVTLLAEAHTSKEISILCEKYTFIRDILYLPETNSIDGTTFESIKCKLENNQSSRIILPLFISEYKFQFIENAQMPFIRHHYAKFRQLWCLGFREFLLYNLHGERLYKIPVLLDKYENTHLNERCFIVGNGPSLNDLDMTLLKNEITFGCNRGFLGTEGWGFNYTYWAFGDRLQVEEYYHEYETGIDDSTIKFYPFEYLPYLHLKNSCPINFLYGYQGFPKFSGKVDVQYLGHSMVYMLLQIAIAMGCNPIILIGVDNKYKLKKSNKDITTWKGSDAEKPTHFDSRYTEGNKKFVPPRPEKADEAYLYASKWTSNHGINVLNATPNSALKVFEAIDYNTLF